MAEMVRSISGTEHLVLLKDGRYMLVVISFEQEGYADDEETAFADVFESDKSGGRGKKVHAFNADCRIEDELEKFESDPR